MFNLALLKFQFKLKHSRLPYYFSNMLTQETGDHSHDTRFRDDPRLPVPRTSHAKETIRHHLPIFIESMPDLITDKINTHSEKGFAHYAKTKFLNDYSYDCNIRNCHTCNHTSS